MLNFIFWFERLLGSFFITWEVILNDVLRPFVIIAWMPVIFYELINKYRLISCDFFSPPLILGEKLANHLPPIWSLWGSYAGLWRIFPRIRNMYCQNMLDTQGIWHGGCCWQLDNGQQDNIKSGMFNLQGKLRRWITWQGKRGLSIGYGVTLMEGNGMIMWSQWHLPTIHPDMPALISPLSSSSTDTRHLLWFL